jgi:hypothetical protein
MNFDRALRVLRTQLLRQRHATGADDKPGAPCSAAREHTAAAAAAAARATEPVAPS